MNQSPTTLDATAAQQLLSLCPAYKPSPLYPVTEENRSVWIKDETDRMGLGSFKALGGVYAVARVVEQETGIQFDETPESLASIKSLAKDISFVCCSAGNHGLAVACGASLFGASARVYLSNEVPLSFTGRLEAQGATVVRAGDTYEQSMDAASNDSESTGALLLADAAWEGYTERPRLIMEGYTVLVDEMTAEFEDTGTWPTHVYLQAGVGGLAAAVAYQIRATWPQQPVLTVVEPEFAACLKTSVALGQLTTVEGDVSVMHRLDCKTPSTISLEILKSAGCQYVTVSEEQAQAACDKLAAERLLSTPSGVAGFAAFLQADLPQSASALVIVSEGRT